MHFLNIFYFRYKLKDNTVNQDRLSVAATSVQVTIGEALFSPKEKRTMTPIQEFLKFIFDK